jgi:hypothetical protein
MEDAYTSTVIAAGDGRMDACRLLVTRVTSVLWRRQYRGVCQSRRMHAQRPGAAARVDAT